ncbi:MAG: ketoacyl-ACP synthase III [Anaerolineae bacterium]|nr:ketoacyl-ACP synthase III [Anaerolineae bacterium]
MGRLYSRITGWGKYAPPRIVTNYDLEKTLDTSHEWIMQRTGIAQRHIAAENETTATMAIAASHKALAEAGLTAKDVDLIIVATSTPDYHVPAVSSNVQAMLEADCPAFTLVTGCTGFVYALVTAHQFIINGAFKNILVVGVELVSRFLDWNDRNTCVLFGDGAGAVVLTASETPQGVLGFDLGSNGADSHHLMMEGGGSADPMSYEVIEQGKNFLRMNGREVFKFATRVLPKSTQAALAHAGLTLEDMDLLIPHQANARIIDMAVRSMKLDADKVFVNLQNYGNTSAASIPIAMVEALEEGKIKNGDKIALVSFGAGLTWASAIVQWGPATTV